MVSTALLEHDTCGANIGDQDSPVLSTVWAFKRNKTFI